MSEPKLRVRHLADGRLGFPEVVRYRLRDGSTVLAPPLDGTPYRTEVLDEAGYRRLDMAGHLGVGHRLSKPARIIDNRATR